MLDLADVGVEPSLTLLAADTLTLHSFTKHFQELFLLSRSVN